MEFLILDYEGHSNTYSTIFLFFRCADKILTQLEIHADAVLAQGTTNTKLSSLKNNIDPVSITRLGHP